MKKRIKHNNLLPWFTQDHGTLPAAYLASCEKFFRELKNFKLARLTAANVQKKRQAPSAKPQASSLTGHKPDDISRIIKEKL